MLLEKKINIKKSVLDYIRYKQLNWYGHVQRMYEERLPQKCSNGAHLEDKQREDLEIRGCMRLQQEWDRGELTTLNGSTEKGEEEK